MITTISEYEIACRQLDELEAKLEKLQSKHSGGEKGYTKAGVRKLIAKLHEELAIYEASIDSTQIES
jgi:hypothetical protein